MVLSSLNVFFFTYFMNYLCTAFSVFINTSIFMVFINGCILICFFHFDVGTDAIVLGAETLRGLYPVETISTVGKICAEVGTRMYFFNYTLS